MPIPWLTVLQSVPWSDVISNAPKVAGGAKKLWDSVARKPAAAAGDATQASPEPAALTERVAALEAQVAELHRQMLTSSEVIQALAEQNTQLIQRVDVHRRWVRRLALALGGVALGVLVLGAAFLQRAS
jgi:hypothetical protein